MQQQCPDCQLGGLFGKGNGKCSNCYGGGKVGTIADDIAGGKRSCPRCHGTGKCPTCGGSGLVSGSTASASSTLARPHAKDELNPFDDKVAVRVHCPKCGALDWFEWKFLGKLTDPVCGHTWYAGSGTYGLMQLRAALAAGGKFSKHMSSGTSGGQGAWIAKAMGWIIGLILGIGFRLEFGILMIPIQAIAGLCQSDETQRFPVARSIVLAVFAVAFGIGIYQVGKDAKSGPTSALQPRFSQPASRTANTSGAATNVSRPKINSAATVGMPITVSSSLDGVKHTLFGKWYWAGSLVYSYITFLDEDCLMGSDDQEEVPLHAQPNKVTCHVMNPNSVSIQFVGSDTPTAWQIESASESELRLSQLILMGPEQRQVRDERVLQRARH